ncbi:MAG: outer membrane beta-barrel protein, partial [Bacteroidota bacterium]
MKHFFLIGFCWMGFLLIHVMPGQAQTLQFSVETGWLSSLNTDYALSDWQHRRQAWMGGLKVRYARNERWTIGTGAQWLQQGYQDVTCYVDEQGNPPPLFGKRNYLGIPFFVERKLGKQGHWLVQAGPYLAFNVKASQEYDEGVGGCALYYIRDLRGFTHDLYVGGTAGVGYRWEVAPIGEVRLWGKALGSLSAIDPFRRNHSFL